MESHLSAPRTLLVRHFPDWLSREEKESLLRHFGAQDVVIMGLKGKMRNCAFATFTNEGETKWVLNKLHQLDVFGHKLSVEYAQPAHTKILQESDTLNWACNRSRPSDSVSEEKSSEGKVEQVYRAIKPVSTVEAPRYLYPPPTPTILSNITNALACVPQLYVQVLHLMNRMNLPPPFGEPTSVPPLLSQECLVEEPADYTRSSEEDGSEIASDEDGLIRKARPAPVSRRVPKRRAVSYAQMKNLLPSLKKGRTQDSPEVPQAKKIELNIPSEMVPRKELEAHTITYIREEPLEKTTPGALLIEASAPPSTSLEGASGNESSKESGLEGGDEKFISNEELRANRKTEKEMQEYSVYNKYSRGESSMRLYIKNLGKHVEEKDLRYIYGRYVNWSSEKEVNAFDIRLMQTGRMKGQAFIGLPSEKIAAKALRDTNGYLLQDRPMVVQFGRSTKAKEKSEN
ncbi:RNA-binding region-containing protein 3-like isoform X2 [Halichondria panicea]|uniref:RNA-binding region-containing protein 3-like isoform X2 n=1 Tax=Halichondria panicea TaxID=6063 RepID=UPI00312B5475